MVNWAYVKGLQNCGLSLHCILHYTEVYSFAAWAFTIDCADYVQKAYFKEILKTEACAFAVDCANENMYRHAGCHLGHLGNGEGVLRGLN